MNTKVSIIIVVWNGEKTIERAMKSVCDQTYPNIQFIVIDGASKDETMNIVERYREKIDFILSEPDKGIYDAMNKGLRAANGELVYFLGSDDYLYDSDVIKKVVAEYELNKPDFLYGNIVIFNHFHNREERRWGERTLSDIKRSMGPSHQASFIKRSVIEENRGFDTRYKISADFDLMAKIYKNKNYKIEFYNLDIAYFETSGSSSTSNLSMIVDSMKILSSHFGLYCGIKFFLLFYLIKWIKILAKKTGLMKVYYFIKLRNSTKAQDR